jgi:hexokinase
MILGGQIYKSSLSFFIWWNVSINAHCRGRYLAIDVGGTNLRVGFIELAKVTKDGPDLLLRNGVSDEPRLEKSRVRRILEKSWPIGEHLKNEKAEDLFAWIGDCIADVVEDGVEIFGEDLPARLPMGVTFSFPMMYDIVLPPFIYCRLTSCQSAYVIGSYTDVNGQRVYNHLQSRSRKAAPGWVLQS